MLGQGFIRHSLHDFELSRLFPFALWNGFVDVGRHWTEHLCNVVSEFSGASEARRRTESSARPAHQSNRFIPCAGGMMFIQRNSLSENVF